LCTSPLSSHCRCWPKCSDPEKSCENILYCHIINSKVFDENSSRIPQKQKRNAFTWFHVLISCQNVEINYCGINLICGGQSSRVTKILQDFMGNS
jgi:hypothetical protein